MERDKLCRIERLGGDVAMKVVDMFFEYKTVPEIVDELKKHKVDVSNNDVKRFLDKYRGIKEKRLSKNKKLRNRLLKRIEMHEQQIDKIIQTANEQLEHIKYGEMGMSQKVHALSSMMKAILDAVKTDSMLNKGIKDNVTNITQVNIVNKISKEKQGLRERVLRANFFTQNVDWEEIESKVEEQKRDVPEEQADEFSETEELDGGDGSPDEDQEADY